MRDIDAFDSAYGRLVSAKLAAGLRDRLGSTRTEAADDTAAPGEGTRPPSRLLPRLDGLAPKARSLRRTWRFTE